MENKLRVVKQANPIENEGTRNDLPFIARFFVRGIVTSKDVNFAVTFIYNNGRIHKLVPIEEASNAGKEFTKEQYAVERYTFLVKVRRLLSEILWESPDLNGINHFENFPNEVLATIFDYLDKDPIDVFMDKWNACIVLPLVCKNWNSVATELRMKQKYAALYISWRHYGEWLVAITLWRFVKIGAIQCAKLEYRTGRCPDCTFCCTCEDITGLDAYSSGKSEIFMRNNRVILMQSGSYINEDLIYYAPNTKKNMSDVMNTESMYLAILQNIRQLIDDKQKLKVSLYLGVGFREIQDPFWQCILSHTGKVTTAEDVAAVLYSDHRDISMFFASIFEEHNMPITTYE